MSLAIFWVLFAVAAGVYASNRGRSGIGWFVLSLLISPLLGLIFLAVSKDLSKAAPGLPIEATHVKCPACAEFVLPEAKVCKHCGSVLTPQPDHAQAMQRRAQEADTQDSKNTLIGLFAVMFVIGVVALISRCGG